MKDVCNHGLWFKGVTVMIYQRVGAHERVGTPLFGAVVWLNYSQQFHTESVRHCDPRADTVCLFWNTDTACPTKL